MNRMRLLGWIPLVLGCPRGKEEGRETGAPGGETALEDSGQEDTSPPPAWDRHTWDMAEVRLGQAPGVALREAAWLTVYNFEDPTASFGDPLILGDVTGDGIDDFCFVDHPNGPDECLGFRSPVKGGHYGYEGADFLIEDGQGTTPGVVGDLNGDGVDDVAVRGRFYFGPIGESLNDREYDDEIVYDERRLEVETDQISRGDTDGDGLDDLIVDYLEYVGEDTYGVVDEQLSIYTNVTGGVTYDNPTAILPQTGFLPDGAYIDFGFIGDTNGDGFDDFVMDRYSGGQGITVYLGPLVGIVEEPDREILVEGEVAVVGDVDGDGLADLARSGSCTVPRVECASVYLGPVESSVAEVKFEVEERYNDIAWDIAGLGDTSGDGASDLVLAVARLGEYRQDDLYLFEDLGPGVWTVYDATFQGLSAFAIPTVAGPADVNGDGSPDLLFGEILADLGDSVGVGRVVLFDDFQ